MWTHNDDIDTSTQEKQGHSFVNTEIVRAESGRFASGYSGNPGGRRGLPIKLRNQLEAGVPNAIRRLIELINSDDDRVALAASEALLSRLYGKPSIAVDTTVSNVPGRAHYEALKALSERAKEA